MILGDFNQRIPRLRQPQNVFDALMDALGPDIQLATAAKKGYETIHRFRSKRPEQFFRKLAPGDE